MIARKEEQKPRTTTISKEQVKTYKYANTVRKLSDEEYQALKDSIAKHGLVYPIIVNREGHILDGHHRYRACQELEVVEPVIVIKENDFANEIDERIFVKRINSDRRQLTEFQKYELALSLMEDYNELAKHNMSLGGKGLPIGKTFNSAEEACKDVIGCSKTTMYKIKEILEAAKKSPEKFGNDVEALRQNKRAGTEGGRTLSINKLLYKVRKDQAVTEKRAQLAREAEGLRLPTKVTLLNRDSLEGDIPEIKDDSVDLIVTDPEYGTDMLHCFEWLAGFAARKLRLGGSVVFYPGYRLDKVMAMFAKYYPTVQYAWQIAVVHTGHTAKVWELGVWSAWKPMLWFTKGSPAEARRARASDMSDLVESQPPNKAIHEWAQSPFEALHVIKNLTLDENALVVDPFLGSGTFGIAAAQLGRCFVGIEIDGEKFKLADLNIKKARGLLSLPSQEAYAVVAPASYATISTPPSNV